MSAPPTNSRHPDRTHCSGSRKARQGTGNPHPRPTTHREVPAVRVDERVDREVAVLFGQEAKVLKAFGSRTLSIRGLTKRWGPARLSSMPRASCLCERV